MSAPDVNIEKQSRRHKGPLIGMAVGLIFAFGLFTAYTGYVWEPVADEPEAAIAVEN
ncbi:hypothetical protein MWU61_17530 [Loktanella sp. F6476L]|uniref:hypothetical protein n=1 Tax=Loktanella sp. F6476L TaxID=2926405 RepID=UPI001FF170B3|nr:hypothetical protein [Loktanella sp. F6476L]MCK0122360.1 hypothetical protein [Loktanella sp. F6476L]UWR01352.1 hypothetical protein K3729_18845 [Rhodobacteraceae bacterium S2214]